jgi:hypothetical protein
MLCARSDLVWIFQDGLNEIFMSRHLRVPLNGIEYMAIPRFFGALDKIPEVVRNTE